MEKPVCHVSRSRDILTAFCRSDVQRLLPEGNHVSCSLSFASTMRLPVAVLCACLPRNHRDGSERCADNDSADRRRVSSTFLINDIRACDDKTNARVFVARVFVCGTDRGTFLASPCLHFEAAFEACSSRRDADDIVEGRADRRRRRRARESSAESDRQAREMRRKFLLKSSKLLSLRNSDFLRTSERKRYHPGERALMIH